MLSQFRFCAAGVGLGTAYTLQRKHVGATKGTSFLPMVAGGALGSLADLYYGYTVACIEEKERFQRYNREQGNVLNE